MKNKDVIIALDFDTKEQLLNMLEALPNTVDNQNPYVKVGMELYYQFGNEIIEILQKNGYRIFLDLKLHDIPNTVIKAMKVLKKLDVEMINLHAKVGKYCMEQVAEIFKNTKTKVIAVTELTSTSSAMLENELACRLLMEESVLHLAKLTKEAGLDGVVCSPLEVPMIKKACGNDFLCVTPGIRYQQNDDQVRITTPKRARELGSDYIVVGREITNNKNPGMVYQTICNEFKEEV